MTCNRMSGIGKKRELYIYIYIVEANQEILIRQVTCVLKQLALSKITLTNPSTFML